MNGNWFNFRLWIQRVRDAFHGRGRRLSHRPIRKEAPPPTFKPELRILEQRESFGDVSILGLVTSAGAAGAAGFLFGAAALMLRDPQSEVSPGVTDLGAGPALDPLAAGLLDDSLPGGLFQTMTSWTSSDAQSFGAALDEFFAADAPLSDRLAEPPLEHDASALEADGLGAGALAAALQALEQPLTAPEADLDDASASSSAGEGEGEGEGEGGSGLLDAGAARAALPTAPLAGAGDALAVPDVPDAADELASYLAQQSEPVAAAEPGAVRRPIATIRDLLDWQAAGIGGDITGPIYTLADLQAWVNAGFQHAPASPNQSPLPGGASIETLSATAVPSAPTATNAIAFVANTGQADPDVQFVGQAPGFSFELAVDGATFYVDRSGTAGTGAPDESIRVQFVGANIAPQVTGANPVPPPVTAGASSASPALPTASGLPPSTNPLDPTPSRPAAAHAATLAYAQVNYQHVYNGIDLTFYTNAQGQLEYDWIVAAHADASQIRLAYTDAERLALDAEGNLQVFTATGGFQVHAPILYQETTGPLGTLLQQVEGRYVIEGNQVSFAIGAYDHSRALIIDPIITWTGGGSTNNWSEGANWSSSAAPTSADTALFDGTSTKNATVDASFAGTVTQLQIAAGYTGTVTLGRDLTLSGSYSQAAGTFDAQAQTLAVTQNFTATAGTFTAGTGTVRFNSGSGSHAIDVNGGSAGSLTFNDLAFGDTGTGTRTYTIGAGDTLNVAGNFTEQAAGGTPVIVTNGGTIAVQGNVTVGAGASGGTTVLQFANTTADQTYTSTGGVLSVVEVANGTRTVSAAVGTTALAVQSLILTSGTLAAPTGTLTITNDLTQTGGSFTAGTGTVHFNNASTSSVTQNINFNGGSSGSLSFNHLILGGTGASTKTFSIGAGDTLNVAGNLTVQRNGGTPLLVSNGGTIAVQGNVAVGAGANGGSTVVQFANTSANQTYTSTGGILSVVEVANGTRTVNAASGTTDLAVQSLILTSGTLAAPTGTLTITNDLTQTSGAFTAGTGTVHFTNASTSSVTQNLNFNGGSAGSLSFNHLVLGGTGASTKTFSIGSGDTLNVAGNLTVQRNSGTPLLVSNGGTIAVQGNVTVGAGANGGSTVVQFANTTADQTYTSTGGILSVVEVANGTRTVSAAVGTTDLAVQSLVLTSGTLAAPTGTLTITNDLTQTGGSFTAGTGTVHFNNASTSSVTQNLNFNGGATGSLGFNHLVLGGSGASTKTFAVGSGDTLNVAGNFTMQRDGGTPLLVSNGGTIAVQGNVAVGAGANGGSTVVRFANTSADQTYSSTGGVLSVVEVANGTRTVSAASGTTDLAVQSLVLTSGTFAAPTGTLTVTNDLTQTSGAFAAGTGTVHFNNPSASSVTQNLNFNGGAAGSLSFNHLVLGGTGASTKTFSIGTGDTLNVAGNFTLQRGGGTPLLVTNSGTIAVQGNVTVGAGASGGTTVIQFANTAANQTYTSTGGVLPVVEVADGTRTVSAASGTTDLAVQSLILTSGTLAGPSGTLTIVADLTQTGGAFTAGTGTLLFNNSSAASATHNININGATGGLLNDDLVFGDGGSGTKTYNIAAGDGFFVHGNFTAQRQSGSTATILVNGGIFDVVGTTTLGTGYQAGTPAPIFNSITAGLGVVSGALYDDLNGDGQKQAADPGLAGRTVELLNGGGAVIATTQTGTTGFYQFLNLAPGSYTVRQLVPTGWTQTAAPAGTVTVVAGENTIAHFGAFQHITITGTKYHDLNGDGVRQSNEPGLAGWTFLLYIVTGGVVSSAPLQVTTTDVNGDYGFFDLGPLPPGTSYVVAEQLTGDWTQTAPQSSSPNSILMPDGTYGFIVPATSGIPISTGGSASGTGTLKLNQRNNSTTATVTYNDSAGHTGSASVFLTQFNVTWNGAGGPATFNTFCVDLFHTVTVGQTFQVTARPDLAPAFTNGSRLAYVYQKYGTVDLTGNAVQAAAVQVALWSLSLDNHYPTFFTQDPDGSYSSGDQSVFEVSFGTNPDAAAIAALVNQYLVESLDSAAQGGWFDAALAGDAVNRGQSMLLPPRPLLFGNDCANGEGTATVVSPTNDPYQADFYPIGDGYTQVALTTGDLITSNQVYTTCGSDGFG